MIYRIEITPFRIESCSGPDSYKIGDHVVIRSKEGLDIGRIVTISSDPEAEVYAELERLAGQPDFERREELKQYEEKCLLELKRAVDEFKYSMKPVYAHCQFDEMRGSDQHRFYEGSGINDSISPLSRFSDGKTAGEQESLYILLSHD